MQQVKLTEDRDGNVLTSEESVLMSEENKLKRMVEVMESVKHRYGSV